MPPSPRRPVSLRVIFRVLVVLAGAVVIADTSVGERGLIAVVGARREYRQLAAEIDRLRAQNAALREQARRLREDATVIEEVARRELGLIRPGEKVFIIRDVGPADSSKAAGRDR
jgi:cell division protein FtsB